MGTESIYLSIDLDYWMRGFSPEEVFKNLERILMQAREMEIPIFYTLEHHTLLDRINASGARKLRNKDYHADLRHLTDAMIGKGPLPFDWVGFVSWGDKGTYEWIYPDRASFDMEIGANMADPLLYSLHPDSAFSGVLNAGYFGWANIISQQGTSDTDLCNVLEIGIALSPDYTPASIISGVMPLLEKYCTRLG